MPTRKANAGQHSVHAHVRYNKIKSKNMLFPPTISELVSECSSFIKLEGQFPGATVNVFSNGFIIMSKVAQFSSETFTLDVTLIAGQNLTTSQIYNEEDSGTSLSEGVEVQKRPAKLSSVYFASPIYKCIVEVAVIGGMPGAEIQVNSLPVPNSPSGNKITIDGRVMVPLLPESSSFTYLQARQKACGMPPVNYSKSTKSLNPPFPFPQLKIVNEVYECIGEILIQNLVEGFPFDIQLKNIQTNDFSIIASFGSGTGSTKVSVKSLREGDVIRAAYGLSFCPNAEIITMPSEEVVVQPLEALPKPIVTTKPCLQGTLVLGNLVRNAIVTMFINGNEFGRFSSPSDSHKLFIKFNSETDEYYFKQEICGFVSTSDKYYPQKNVFISPAVTVGPLYESAPVIFVNIYSLTDEVYVYSKNSGIISKKYKKNIINNPIFTQIPLNPSLTKNDKIKIVTKLCDGSSKESDEIPVILPPGHIQKPDIINAFIEDYYIEIKGLHGAQVHVYLASDDSIIGIDFSGPESTPSIIYLNKPLNLGGEIKVFQTLYGITSPEARFMPKYPPPLGIDFPYPGLVGDTGGAVAGLVPYGDVEFGWTVIGGGLRRATSFDIIFENPVDAPSVFGITDNKQTCVLKPDTNYKYNIKSYNMGGSKMYTGIEFRTKPAPPSPPPPVVPSPAPVSALFLNIDLYFSDDGINVINWLEDERETKIWLKTRNIGSAPSKEGSVVRFHRSGNGTVEMNEDISLPVVNVGENMLISWDVPKLPKGRYYFIATILDDNSIPISLSYDNEYEIGWFS